MKVLRKHCRDAPTSKLKPLATLLASAHPFPPRPPPSLSSFYFFFFRDDTFSSIEVPSFDRCAYAYTEQLWHFPKDPVYTGLLRDCC